MAKKKAKAHPGRGPLPIDDRNSELQIFSLRAVERAFSPEEFIVRREGEPDRGVDVTIELKERIDSSGRATGEKANVQVKSCERVKGSDGQGTSKCQELSSSTIAYPVHTYNLNQLLSISS